VRRILPFYSWMRWATLYSLRIATEAPVRANIIAKMSRDFYMLTGQNKLPEHLQGSVPIGNDEDGTVYYLKTRGLNPFSHLNDLMGEGIAGAAIQSAAPGIKTGLEQGLGQDVFLGIPFTRDRVGEYTDPVSNRLFKFDPELGKTVEVTGKVKPALLENIMRNYIPQYLMMEVLLTGGKQRYSAEGLDTILSDLFKDPKERQAVVKDIVTMEPKERTSILRELGKALGINIKDVEPADVKARRESIQRATSAIKNRELPILNPQFKAMIRERILKSVSDGKSKDEIKEDLKVWIGDNAAALRKLAE